LRARFVCRPAFEPGLSARPCYHKIARDLSQARGFHPPMVCYSAAELTATQPPSNLLNVGSMGLILLINTMRTNGTKPLQQIISIHGNPAKQIAKK
jgi:hypothetical protein